MTFSAASHPDRIESHASLDQASDCLRIVEALRTLGDAPDEAAALDHFEEALRLLGADAAVFLSFTRDDATRTSFRWLLACDPLWAVEYARNGWHKHDPWLRHALERTEPVIGAELSMSPEEEQFASKSAGLGFASTVIVPAPSNAGTSRVGVLCLGSRTAGFFDRSMLSSLRILGRALAMELHRWMLHAMRNEMLRSTRITIAELELLRYEEAGHTSKHIGALLGINAKTVDSRFQKLITKLRVPDRRTAARIARLYGLL